MQDEKARWKCNNRNRGAAIFEAIDVVFKDYRTDNGIKIKQ